MSIEVQMEANARLIAAAPDLLAALQECLNLMLSNGLDECDAYVNGCAAHTKATGSGT